MTPGNVPWPLLGGVVLGVAACALRLRRGRDARGPWAVALGLGALFAATWLARARMLPFAYFQQNGHGPRWIDYLLRPGSDNLLERKLMTSYGPGYYEVFSAVARLGTNPDRAVFLSQSLLGALAPPLAWLLARRSGARPLVAWSLAATVALDPFLIRLAQSESYIALCVALLLGAAAVLAPSDPRVRVASPGFVLSTLAAGLLVAQAVRTHPMCWFAAGMVPAVVLLGPGPLATRARLCGWSTLGVGATAGLVSGNIVYFVVSSPLANRLHTNPELDLRAWLLAWAGVALATGIALRRAPRRWRTAVLAPPVAALALFVLEITNVVDRPNAAFDGGRMHLCLPVLVAALAACTAPLARRPWGAGALALLLGAAGAGAASAVWQLVSLMPTDALEASWALEWRARLPAGARVLYLQDVGMTNSTLPLYPFEAHFAHSAGTPIPSLDELGSAPFYYRSSLCSRASGRQHCEELESHFTLAPVAARDLPARASMFRSGFDVPVVRVALYRVTGVASRR